MAATSWPLPPTRLDLPNDEAHVWCAPLARPAAEVNELASLLAPDELDRALQLRSAAKQCQQIVARGLLRQLLGRYLDLDPRRITFQYGPQGKPHLPAPLAALHFNISHSHEMALFAFAWNIEVGVDVERVRPFSNDLGFAERYFSAQEVDILRGLSEERRREAFFNAWTRKEAFLKATGEGISSGLDRVEVTLHPDDPPSLVRLNGDTDLAERWLLHALRPAQDYVGALCIPRRSSALSCWSWPAAPSSVAVA